MAIDFVNFSNVTNKNGVLTVLWNAISTSFSINWDFVDNPFLLSNTQRTNFNPLIRDDFSNKIIANKKEVYKNNPKILRHKFFLLDNIKIIEYLDIQPLDDEEPISEEIFKEAVFYISKTKVLWDLQLTILRELYKQFFVYPSWVLILKPQDTYNVFNEEDPEHEKIRAIFSLPFDLYFRAIQNFPKELVDEVVMAEEHKIYKNERLPVKVLPLLARETLVTKDWTPLQLSYRQMYKAFHSVKKRFVRNACPRQSGKTYDAVRDCYQRLLSADYYRIIYICETETAFEQPWNYFESALKKAKDYGIIQMNRSDFTITCPFGWPTGNTLTFVSSASKLWPRSLNGNFFVFDEWGKIKSSVRLDARPIINNSNASVLVNSTIFREMKKYDSERFYNNLLQIELWFKQDDDWTDEWMALRVNIDQIERLSDKQKKAAKAELRPYPERYFCELYSQLPRIDDSVFPDGFFIMMDEDKIQKDDFVLLCRDLAKRVDTAWMVLIAQKDWIIFHEQRLKWYTYTQQIQIVKELKQMYPNLKVVADISNEESFIENNPTLIDYPVKFTSSTSWYKRETRNGITVRSVWKETLVNNFVQLAETNKLRALSKLEMLRLEAENYMATRNGRGWMSYAAASWTDDLVSAVLAGAFIFKITYLDPLGVWEAEREKKKKALENIQRDDDWFVIKKQWKKYYNWMY